jgi:hypothetical protein
MTSAGGVCCSDPTTTAVLAEDAAAVAGLGIAGACLTAAHLTGLSHYDALGSVAVGGLLGVTAVHLIDVNRNGLLGRSMSPHVCEKILVCHRPAAPPFSLVRLSTLPRPPSY